MKVIKFNHNLLKWERSHLDPSKAGYILDKPSRPIIDYCKGTVSSTQLAHELRYNDNNEDKGIQKPLQIDCARAIQNDML